MSLKLEDRNLYILDELTNSIIVFYDNRIVKQNIRQRTNIKAFKDKYGNSFKVAEFNNGSFCVFDINIKHYELIHNILTSAICNHEEIEAQDLVLYRLVINNDKPLNLDFGNLLIKIKHHFYDLSIYDKTSSSNPVTFKLHNNFTIYTNLKFERLQVNSNIIFTFKPTEKIRYVQINSRFIYLYMPVNEVYKSKMISIIDQLLASYA